MVSGFGIAMKKWVERNLQELFFIFFNIFAAKLQKILKYSKNIEKKIQVKPESSLIVNLDYNQTCHDGTR